MSSNIIFSALLAGGQSVATPPALAPVGKWVVEYNQANCTLSRPFGTAAAPITFGFKPSADMASGELLLLAPGPLSSVGRGSGSVTILPSGERFEVRWARGPLPTAGQHGVRFDADQPFWDALPTAKELELDVGEPNRIRLILGPTDKALAAVKTCGDDLLRGWGADPAALIKPDGARLARLFGSDQYPPAALSAHQQGRVQTLSTVDKQGRVVSCVTVESSGSTPLDTATCSIVRDRGRFAPGDAGAPARRYVIVAVHWLLPD